MTVDPAISTKADADYTSIIVNGVDWRNHWYIQEAWQSRCDPLQTIEKIFEFAIKYKNIVCLGMEKYALEKFLAITLNEEMQKRNIHIPIKEIDNDNRVSKNVRIRSLQPKFFNHYVWLKKDDQEQDALYRQLIMHPQLQHDDLVDALKSQLQITFPAKKPPDAVDYGPDLSKLPPDDRYIWKSVDKLIRRHVKQMKGVPI